MRRSDLSAIWRFLSLAVLGVAFSFSTFAADGTSCSANEETRQLDFWLGTWTVRGPGGSGTSEVTLDLNKCLFVESWDGARSHAGKNFLGYSPDDKKWYALFGDNEGRVHIFTSGKVAAGVAEFDGPSSGPKGETVLNRVKIVRDAPGKIEQIWDKSTDGGASWNTVFRGEYSRVSR